LQKLQQKNKQTNIPAVVLGLGPRQSKNKLNKAQSIDHVRNVSF